MDVKDTVTSHQEGRRFYFQMRPCSVEFACSSHDGTACSLQGPHSTDVHVRMIGNSKLATGVSVRGCLSLRDRCRVCYIAFTPRQLKLLHLPTLSYHEGRVSRFGKWMDYIYD